MKKTSLILIVLLSALVYSCSKSNSSNTSSIPTTIAGTFSSSPLIVTDTTYNIKSGDTLYNQVIMDSSDINASYTTTLLSGNVLQINISSTNSQIVKNYTLPYIGSVTTSGVTVYSFATSSGGNYNYANFTTTANTNNIVSGNLMYSNTIDTANTLAHLTYSLSGNRN